MNQIELYNFSIKDKNTDPKQLAQMILGEEAILNLAMQNLLAKEDVIRFKNFEALLLVAEQQPDKLHLHWDFFYKMLLSSNNFHKYIGIYLIASLAQYDPENKFGKIFDVFFGLLQDESIVTVNHTIKVAAQIMKHRPELRTKITGLLLSIENIRAGAKHLDLTLAYVIETFQECFSLLENQEEIIQFVQKQNASSSPKTRKAAKAFYKFLELQRI